MDETKIICEEYVNALHSGGDRRRKRLCSTTRLMLAHVERIEKKMEERLNDCFFSNENNDVACAFEACIKRLLADQRINWGRILERVKVISGFQKFEITKYMKLQMCIT